MRISDLENQSLVGTVMVLEAIATELLAGYLRGLAPADRDAALARMSADVAANGKQLVELAPKPQAGNALKTQASAARQMAAVAQEALALIAPSVLPRESLILPMPEVLPPKAASSHEG